MKLVAIDENAFQRKIIHTYILGQKPFFNIMVCPSRDEVCP
jgi:hypothetical protein